MPGILTIDPEKLERSSMNRLLSVPAAPLLTSVKRSDSIPTTTVHTSGEPKLTKLCIILVTQLLITRVTIRSCLQTDIMVPCNLIYGIRQFIGISQVFCCRRSRALARELFNTGPVALYGIGQKKPGSSMVPRLPTSLLHTERATCVRLIEVST